MSMYDLRHDTEEYYNRAVRKAVEYVEKSARLILREHQELDEFIMGMGYAGFTVKEGTENIVFCDSPDINAFSPEGSGYHFVGPSLESLAEFLCEWDEYLKITGEPMRFTADGPKVTEW